MPVSKSKVHYCTGQIKVIERKLEPTAPHEPCPCRKLDLKGRRLKFKQCCGKCRCRQLVSLTEATKMVKNGDASWVVTKRTRTTRQETCHLCKGDPKVRFCANCKDSRFEVVPYDAEEYANDIVKVSRPPADQMETKQSSALAAKTPRVATIEEEHILRAYVSDYSRELVAEAERGGKQIHKYIDDQTSPKTAQAIRARIKEYGKMTREALLYIGKTRIPMVKPEPPDDPATGTGRQYDWGRTI